MNITTRSVRARGLIGATLGVALAAAALVPLQAPAQALITPVVTAGGAGAKVTLNDDHYHPGDTIEISGEGFTLDPLTANNPGSAVIAVKVNGDDYAESGLPWPAGGPSAVDPSTLPTAGGSGGYAAFVVEDGEFEGTLTIPASWNPDNPESMVLNFLGGSLSTSSPGKVLSPIGVQTSVNVLDDDEEHVEITTQAHTPGSNNNQAIGVKLRNYQRADGLGGQKVAFSFDGAGAVVHCAETDAEGDANVSVPLPSAAGSLTPGTHQLTVSAGDACGDGAQLPARAASLPFKVTTAEITSSTHVVGGTLSLKLNGFQANSTAGQKVAVMIGQNGPGATTFPGVVPGTSTAICVQTNTAGNATATVGIPDQDFLIGDHFVILLAGTSCGAGLPGSNGAVRSIPVPVTIAPRPALAATGTAAVSGTAKVGNLLRAAAPAWNLSGVTVAHQWLRNGAPINGATASSYLTTAADAGAAVSVRVTGTRGTESISSTSASLKVSAGTIANSKRPTVSGTAKVGKALKAKAGTWSVPGVTVRYQWLRNGKVIKGATKAKYKLAKKDRKKKVSVKVTVSAPGYTAATAASAAKKIK